MTSDILQQLVSEDNNVPLLKKCEILQNVKDDGADLSVLSIFTDFESNTVENVDVNKEGVHFLVNACEAGLDPYSPVLLDRLEGESKDKFKAILACIDANDRGAFSKYEKDVFNGVSSPFADAYEDLSVHLLANGDSLVALHLGIDSWFSRNELMKMADDFTFKPAEAEALKAVDYNLQIDVEELELPLTDAEIKAISDKYRTLIAHKQLRGDNGHAVSFDNKSNIER